MKTVPCKLCGKPILWATDEKGTRHPLDPRAPVFSFNGGDLNGSFQVHRQEGAWVTHFATCKNVADLKRRKEAGGERAGVARSDPAPDSGPAL